jgi:hypothetical protein
VLRCISGLLGRCRRHSFGIPWSSQAFFNFNEFANLCTSQGLTFLSGASATDATRAWTVVSTRRSWFSSRKSWDVNWFSKQLAFTLAFSFGVCYFSARISQKTPVVSKRVHWPVAQHWTLLGPHRKHIFCRVLLCYPAPSRTVHREHSSYYCVFAGTRILSRCLAVGRYVTILCAPYIWDAIGSVF